MKPQLIEYRDENFSIVARMNDVCGRGAAIVVAQKYLAQMASIDSATVSDDETETVVSRATEWTKRNG